MIELIRRGGGRRTPVFRQVFTSRFFPEGSPEQIEWWNELCRKDDHAGHRGGATSRARRDQRHGWRGPRSTLVIHARKNEICPLAEGRLVASGIRGAEFVELDSRNDVLLEQDPQAAIQGGRAGLSRRGPAFGALSAREREILTLLAEGLGNAEIGERLAISEKTVRNHVSNLFDKLGVWTRAQAIARDRGFGR